MADALSHDEVTVTRLSSSEGGSMSVDQFVTLYGAGRMLIDYVVEDDTDTAGPNRIQ